jgi:hypothetical protein
MTTDLRAPSGDRRTFFALALALTLAAGCASLRGYQAKQQYIKDQTRSHVYARPIATVWPEVRKLLFEKGFKTKDSDSGNSFALETEEKKDGEEMIRYLVTGTKVDEGACRVEFTRVATGKVGRPATERDLDMEWTLLRRVEPDSGQKIEGEAVAVGEKAKS